MVKLNQSAGEIQRRCDGSRCVPEDRRRAGAGFDATDSPTTSRSSSNSRAVSSGSNARGVDDDRAKSLLRPPGPPLWLLAELTYRCPLHCAFCYNPVEFAASGPELPTDDWLRVLREARAQPVACNVVLRRRAAAARRTSKSSSPKRIGSASTRTC